ncbi:hypothetical protein [Holospora undulata]|uniref:Uncharacterized protein n=1 Tax=Holospora undulata HU1 TaxID=1321371 RepID=A0A061JIJ0_9PROT|nr:hypothetical protein [Holospora undulata]ETZ05487.1 hypothetical protein K737_300072 [Holospora undulata HU1]
MNDKVLLSLIFLIFENFFVGSAVYGSSPKKETTGFIEDVSVANDSDTNAVGIFSSEMEEFNYVLINALQKSDDEIGDFDSSKEVIGRFDRWLRVPENFHQIANCFDSSVAHLGRALEQADSVRVFETLAVLKKNSFPILNYVLSVLDSTPQSSHLDAKFVQLCKTLDQNAQNYQSESFFLSSSCVPSSPVQNSSESFFSKLCKIFKRMIGFKDEEVSVQTVRNVIRKSNNIDANKNNTLGSALSILNYIFIQNSKNENIVHNINKKVIYDSLDDLNMKNKNLLGEVLFKIFTKTENCGTNFLHALYALKNICSWNSSQDDQTHLYFEQNIADYALRKFISFSCPNLEKLSNVLDRFILADSSSHANLKDCSFSNGEGEAIETFFYVLFNEISDIHSSFSSSFDSKPRSRLSMDRHSRQYRSLGMDQHLSRVSGERFSTAASYDERRNSGQSILSMNRNLEENLNRDSSLGIDRNSGRYSSLGMYYTIEDDSEQCGNLGIENLSNISRTKSRLDISFDEIYVKLTSVCDAILERKNPTLFWSALFALNKIDQKYSLQTVSNKNRKEKENFRKVFDYLSRGVEEDFFHLGLPGLLNDENPKNFHTGLDILGKSYFENFWKKNAIKVLKDSLSTIKIERIDRIILLLLDKKIDLNSFYSILDELDLERVERIISVVLEKKGNLFFSFITTPTLFSKLLNVFKEKSDLFNKTLEHFINCNHYRMLNREFFLETVFCLYEDSSIFHRFLIFLSDFYKEKESSDSWIFSLRTNPNFFGHALVAFEDTLRNLDKESLDIEKNRKNFDTDIFERKKLKESSNKTLLLLLENSGVNSCIVPALVALCGKKITPDHIISALLNEKGDDKLGLALDALERVNKYCFRDVLYGLIRKAGITKSTLIKKVKKSLEDANDSVCLDTILKKIEID